MACLCATRTAGVELVGVQGHAASWRYRARVGSQAGCTGVLLYVAFWFALVMLGVAAAGWAAAANTSDEDEWPFTDLTELRKTPGYDPNLYNDTSHELYTDD